MTNVSPFQKPIEDETFDEAIPADPKPFVKVITTPSGLPWDQIRAARLEARVGAPLPLMQLAYQLKRLEPWGPSKAGRFAAAYIRSSEVKVALYTTAEVDGRSLSFAFYSRHERQRRLRNLMLVGTAAAFTTALLLVGVGSALRTRSESEASLTNLERAVAIRDRQVKALEVRKREVVALNEQGVSGQALTDFLSDLAWASNAKAPDARLEALHWDRGYMAVEARGEAPPFMQSERRTERSAKPIRRGVWLWGVAPEGAR